MKDILIPVSESPECGVALEQGFELGKKLEANVIGYHIRPHSDSEVDMDNDTVESLLTPDEYDLAWESIIQRKQKSQNGSRAKTFFESIASKFSYQLKKRTGTEPCALWNKKVGSPNRLFSIAGPVSDLIVVSRPANSKSTIAKTIMNDAVLNSSTPVLVLPQNKVDMIGENISIAWNQSTDAALAVKAAMPLLTQAKNVTIITSGPEDKIGPKAKHLQAYLAHRGVDAHHLAIHEGDERSAIIKGFNDSNSDLLIMGGYSRSRFRQLLFGGLTEYMLNEAQIPVFIMHK